MRLRVIKGLSRNQIRANEYYTAVDLQACYDLLLKKQKETENHIDRIRIIYPKGIAPKVAKTAYDERKKDRDAEVKRANAFLECIERAFIRLRDGNYGICVATGQKISEVRLLASPVATMTIPSKIRSKMQIIV